MNLIKLGLIIGGILFSLISALIKFESYDERIINNQNRIVILEKTASTHQADFTGLKSTLNEMHNDISIIKNLLLTKGLK